MIEFFSDIRSLHARRAFSRTLEGIMATLAAHDPYTRRHCVHVKEFAGKLAKKMGLDQEAVYRVEYAALVHDLGKIYVPLKILNKQGKLSDLEFAVIQKHPVDSFEVLSNNPIPAIRKLAPIARHHHEKWNGYGYPDRIKDEAIPLESRILSVVDVYDALTTHRPYRKAMDHAKALSIIEKDSGTAFDPEVVDAFVKMSRWSGSMRLWVHMKGWQQHFGK